jgi:hypothetical protein
MNEVTMGVEIVHQYEFIFLISMFQKKRANQLFVFIRLNYFFFFIPKVILVSIILIIGYRYY